MCLIVIGWRVHPDYPLVVAANRDEFHARPTAPLARWPDSPGIIGGRDLVAGGTWLGLSDKGRFAAITNVREPGMPEGECSRGKLTWDFLRSTLAPMEFAEQIEGQRYSGFNLLLADEHDLVYCSNRDGAPRLLEAGVYGLSNHLLDTPWPKLIAARQRFSEALPGLPDETAFFDLLSDRRLADDKDLPNTGVSIEWERLLSAIFVSSENYGTRASTVLWRRSDGAFALHEKSFGPNGPGAQASVISTSV